MTIINRSLGVKLSFVNVVWSLGKTQSSSIYKKSPAVTFLLLFQTCNFRTSSMVVLSSPKITSRFDLNKQ